MPSVPRAQLLARCMLNAPADAAALRRDRSTRSSDALEAADPNADIALDVPCDACGHAWHACSSTSAQLLWDEIDARARRAARRGAPARARLRLDRSARSSRSARRAVRPTFDGAQHEAACCTGWLRARRHRRRRSCGRTCAFRTSRARLRVEPVETQVDAAALSLPASASCTPAGATPDTRAAGPAVVAPARDALTVRAPRVPRCSRRVPSRRPSRSAAPRSSAAAERACDERDAATAAWRAGPDSRALIDTPAQQADGETRPEPRAVAAPRPSSARHAAPASLRLRSPGTRVSSPRG